MNEVIFSKQNNDHQDVGNASCNRAPFKMAEDEFTELPANEGGSRSEFPVTGPAQQNDRTASTGGTSGAEHPFAAVLSRIAGTVDRNNQLLGEISSRLQTCENQLQNMNSRISELDKSLSQLADEIRLQRTADEQVVLQTAMGLVQMIDRQSSEITEAEQGVLAFSVVEECREVDRLDATNMLVRLGFEEMTIMRGSPVDPAHP